MTRLALALDAFCVVGMLVAFIAAFPFLCVFVAIQHARGKMP